MKIIKSRLKEIIKEEIETVLEDFDSAGWPTVPPEHPEGSSGVCIQHTRSGSKKLYKGDEGYEKCLQSKIEETQLRLLDVYIAEEIAEAFGYRKMYSRQPARGVGNLTIDDVQELLPHLSPGEQTDVWEKYKHLNSQDDLRRALRMNEEET